MVYKGMIQVDGTWVPTPAEFTYSVEDLDAEGYRTQDGMLHRKRIGRVSKLQCKWSIVPDTQEYYDFFDLLNNLPEYFEVSYPHPDGTRVTETMYRGNPLQAPMRSYWVEDGHISKWQETSVNFIGREAVAY